MIYVLDACAMIAWLRNEPGADIVDQAIRDLNSQCLAHAINLCEVFYEALLRLYPFCRGGNSEILGHF